MILLSFTSAAKYILSLMLAMLGFIPFEEVRPPSKELAESENTIFQQEVTPLDFMPQKAYFGSDFFNTDKLLEPQPEVVSPRNDYPLDLLIPDNCLVYTVHLQSVLEGMEKEGDLQKRLVVLCKDALDITTSDIVFIQSGI